MKKKLSHDIVRVFCIIWDMKYKMTFLLNWIKNAINKHAYHIFIHCLYSFILIGYIVLNCCLNHQKRKPWFKNSCSNCYWGFFLFFFLKHSVLVFVAQKQTFFQNHLQEKKVCIRVCPHTFVCPQQGEPHALFQSGLIWSDVRSWALRLSLALGVSARRWEKV